MSGIAVTSLRIHPVKSTAVRPVDSAEVTLAGLVGDRRWMVVDDTGQMISAREAHPLFAIVADTAQTDPAIERGLRLRHVPAGGAPAVEPLDVDIPHGPPIPVTLHGNPVLGVPAADSAHEWIRAVVGRGDLRLLWCDDPTRRSLNPAWSRPTDHTAYADSAPLTLASLASLRQLNSWAAQTAADRGDPAPEPLTVDRFRPNIVIDGDLDAFDEDDWSAVTIGGLPFRTPRPVDRCVMTTLDPARHVTGAEPIRTLARERRWEGKTWFAIKLVPDAVGQIAVGDVVVPTG